MDERGFFTEAAGPELQNKNVLEEGNEAGECSMLSHLLLLFVTFLQVYLYSCIYICVN